VLRNRQRLSMFRRNWVCSRVCGRRLFWSCKELYF